MAKAQFQKNQRVWVETVGVWANVEKVVPVWSKGFDEPVKITYDLGLGRDFQAGELRAEEHGEEGLGGGEWRVLRARNKWQEPDDCAHHPFPGTYPVVVTDTQDWDGWRVPGAEYDRDPRGIEAQARMIVSAPKLLRIARELQDFIGEQPDDAPRELRALAKRCHELIQFVTARAAAPALAAVSPRRADAA